MNITDVPGWGPRAARCRRAGGGRGGQGWAAQAGASTTPLYSALSSLVSVAILRRFSLTLINSGAWSSSFSGGFSS